jgi:hypothetical protein
LRQAPHAKFGFVHIPFDYDAAEAAKTIERIIFRWDEMLKNQLRTKT